MASQVAELHKRLKKHGWTLLREGSRHSIFFKGDRTISIPRGTAIYDRSYKQILWQIEGKACAKRYRQVNLRNEVASQPVPERQPS
jgi:hypothetical protein